MAHDAHSARGAITRSSGELGVTLTQLLFLMKGLYVWYKNISRKKYVGLASLMVGPTILQANKSDGPAVIVLIFEPCSDERGDRTSIIVMVALSVNHYSTRTLNWKIKHLQT